MACTTSDWPLRQSAKKGNVQWLVNSEVLIHTPADHTHAGTVRKANKIFMQTD